MKRLRSKLVKLLQYLIWLLEGDVKGYIKMRIYGYKTAMINFTMKAYVWVHGDPLMIKRVQGGVYKLIDGKFIKVQDRPDMETSLDTLTEFAKEIADKRTDDRDAARVRDAELHALSMDHKRPRFGARSSEEFEFMAKEGI